MKQLLSLLLLLLLPLLGVAQRTVGGLLGSGGSGAVVYGTSDQIAPGLIGSLDVLPVSADLHIFRWSEVAAPGEQISLPGYFPIDATIRLSIGDGTRHTPLPIVSQSANYIKATLPGVLPVGVYGIFVQSGSSRSAVRYINRATGYGLNSSYIYSGGPFQITGKNLLLGGKVPTIRFVSQSTGTSLSATYVPQNSNAYRIHALAPLNLVAGQTYSVFVSNGYGGTIGETQVIDESNLTTYGMVAVAAATDMYNLAVGWAPLVTPTRNYTLTGYNNRQAGFATRLQTVIDSLGALSGGKRISLPAGNYTYAKTGTNFAGMDFKNGVAVQGAGKGQTNIEYGTSGTVAKLLYMDVAVTNAGLIDVSLINLSTSIDYGLGLIRGQQFFLKNVAWNAVNGDWLECTASKNILLDNCDIDHNRHTTVHGPVATINSEYINIRGCTINSAQVQIDLTNSSKCFVFGNTLWRDISKTLLAADIIHQMVAGRVQNSHFGGNRFLLRNGPIPRGTLQPGNTRLNDGEAILVEQSDPQEIYSGFVTSATSTGFTDNTKTWAATFAGNVRVFVSIIRGKGVGQVREVTARTTTGAATVSTAWSVIPDGTSYYTTYVWTMRNTAIVDNEFVEQQRGITMYHTNTENVSIVGNRFKNSGSIDFSPFQSVRNTGSFSGSTYLNPNYSVDILSNYLDSSTDPYNGVSVGFQAIQEFASSLGTEVTNLRMAYNTIIAKEGTDLPVIQDDVFTTGYNFYVKKQTSTTYDETTQVPTVLGTILINNICKDCDNALNLNSGTHHTSVLGTTLLNSGFLNDYIISPASSASKSTVQLTP